MVLGFFSTTSVAVAHNHRSLQQVSRQGDRGPEREAYHYFQLIQEFQMSDLYLHMSTHVLYIVL
jgi:hypothetical protein